MLDAELRERYQRRFVGRTLEVLWEEPHPTDDGAGRPTDPSDAAPLWSGLTDNYLRVLAPGHHLEGRISTDPGKLVERTTHGGQPGSGCSSPDRCRAARGAHAADPRHRHPICWSDLMDTCLFCRIVAGTIPSTTIYQDEHVTAFRDIMPQAPVHVLVVPNEHVGSANDLEETHDAIMGRVMDAARGGARGYSRERLPTGH